MFNFFYELASDYGEGIEYLNKTNFVMIGSQLCYLENIKGLVSVNKQSIIIKGKSELFIITGDNLVLKEYTKTTIAVAGKITTIEVSV